MEAIKFKSTISAETCLYNIIEIIKNNCKTFKESQLIINELNKCFKHNGHINIINNKIQNDELKSNKIINNNNNHNNELTTYY